MIEIYNKRRYSRYIFSITLILFSGELILFIWSKKNILIFLILFIIIELVFLSKKFTDKILVEDDKFKIIYYQWAFKHVLELPKKNIKLEKEKLVAIRGHRYTAINIFSNEKLVYTIDNRDGFSDESMEAIKNLKF